MCHLLMALARRLRRGGEELDPPQNLRTLYLAMTQIPTPRSSGSQPCFVCAFSAYTQCLCTVFEHVLLHLRQCFAHLLRVCIGQQFREVIVKVEEVDYIARHMTGDSEGKLPADFLFCFYSTAKRSPLRALPLSRSGTLRRGSRVEGTARHS